MRRALQQRAPALMHFYPGYRPWDAERYSVGELQAMLNALPEGGD